MGPIKGGTSSQPLVPRRTGRSRHPTRLERLTAKLVINAPQLVSAAAVNPIFGKVSRGLRGAPEGLISMAKAMSPAAQYYGDLPVCTSDHVRKHRKRSGRDTPVLHVDENYHAYLTTRTRHLNPAGGNYKTASRMLHTNATNDRPVPKASEIKMELPFVDEKRLARFIRENTGRNKPEYHTLLNNCATMSARAIMDAVQCRPSFDVRLDAVPGLKFTRNIRSWTPRQVARFVDELSTLAGKPSNVWKTLPEETRHVQAVKDLIRQKAPRVAAMFK